MSRRRRCVVSPLAMSWIARNRTVSRCVHLGLQTTPRHVTLANRAICRHGTIRSSVRSFLDKMHVFSSSSRGYHRQVASFKGPPSSRPVSSVSRHRSFTLPASFRRAPLPFFRLHYCTSSPAAACLRKRVFWHLTRRAKRVRARIDLRADLFAGFTHRQRFVESFNVLLHLSNLVLGFF